MSSITSGDISNLLSQFAIEATKMDFTMPDDDVYVEWESHLIQRTWEVATFAQPNTEERRHSASALPMQIILELPYPYPELLPNAARRLHWAVRGKSAAELRASAVICANQQKPTTWIPLKRVNIEITWYAPKKGKQLLPDRDGLLTASKGIIDALQPPRIWKNTRQGRMSVDPGASIIAADSEVCVERLSLHPVKRDCKNPRTVVVIEEVADGSAKDRTSAKSARGAG